VTLRARELAVHAAVGASPRQLLQLVLRSAALVAIAGVAGGWLIATVTTSYLQLLLFQIRPLDVVSFAIAAIILVLLVIIASLRPAARAAGTDPVVLMRSE
jgi:ABC-type antimicrobial peptide transport system permease subunit